MIPDINLIPKVEKQSSDSKLVYILLAIVTLLALSFFVLQYFGARSEVIKLNSQEDSLIAQRDELQAELDSLTTAQAGSLEESVQFVETISYPVSPLIDETQRLLLKNDYLREYEFTTDAVRILIDFETLNDASGYVSRLTKSPFFTDVQVASIENTEIGDAAEGDGDDVDFNVVPRQAAEINLIINKQHLSTGGAN